MRKLSEGTRRRIRQVNNVVEVLLIMGISATVSIMFGYMIFESAFVDGNLWSLLYILLVLPLLIFVFGPLQDFRQWLRHRKQGFK